MPFKKGHTTNLGRKLSGETRKKMSDSHKNLKPFSWGAGFKPGNTPWNRGRDVARNAYFAALLDGEGSIFITNNTNALGKYKKICVAFAMRADKAQPLPVGQRTWGGSLNKRLPRKGNAKEVLDWRLWTKSAEKFLRDVVPYLRIKKEQAEIVLLYRKLQKKKRIGTNVISPGELVYRKTLEDRIHSLNS